MSRARPSTDTPPPPSSASSASPSLSEPDSSSSKASASMSRSNSASSTCATQTCSRCAVVQEVVHEGGGGRAGASCRCARLRLKRASALSNVARLTPQWKFPSSPSAAAGGASRGSAAAGAVALGADTSPTSVQPARYSDESARALAETARTFSSDAFGHGSCALREASQDLVRWDIVRWSELVPEAEFPPAALDEAVAVISSGPGCPALPKDLGAPLADEVAHFAVGKRQAHQPLGARRALVVVHPRYSRIRSDGGPALERLPAAQQRAALEPPLEVAPLRHAAHPRAGRRHRVELRILFERERRVRGLRRLELAHIPPHLGLTERAAAWG
eukprot:scaffold48615_cov64-Phaeocystis_antarctica.AAC.2